VSEYEAGQELGPSRERTITTVLFSSAVVVQLVVLYVPRAPSTGGLPIDKVVHAAIFGAVLWTGVRAGVRCGPLAVVLAVHAVVSELIQDFLLANRDGDWTDSVADLTGVLIVTALLWRRK
jgi:hypothetical protein